MDLLGTGEFESEGVRAVARALLLDEEHHPIEGDPSPAALVGRCFYRVAQAAFRVGVLEDHFEHEDYEDPWLVTSVEFAWVAAFALAAIARIHPDARDEPLVEVKGRLLEGLDKDVTEWADGYGDDWDKLTHGYWLATVTALFTDAADGVAELEGCPAQSPDFWWPDLADGYDDLAEPDEIAERIGNALGVAASAATNAAEWFLEHREHAEN